MFKITCEDILINPHIRALWPFRYVHDVDIGLEKLNATTGKQAKFDKTDYSKLTAEDLNHLEQGLF